MNKAPLPTAFVIACLSCAWFGFWLGFCEMFLEHVDRQYSRDVAELVGGRHRLRCLNEDVPKAIGSLSTDLEMGREALLLVAPKPVSCATVYSLWSILICSGCLCCNRMNSWLGAAERRHSSRMSLAQRSVGAWECTKRRALFENLSSASLLSANRLRFRV
jgi:hypothetical protein